MIISTDVGKAFDKIQHIYQITHNKLGTEGTNLKEINDRPTDNIILNGKRFKVFPLRSGTKTRLSTLSTLIEHNTRSST